jgi:hypothetical protein
VDSVPLTGATETPVRLIEITILVPVLVQYLILVGTEERFTDTDPLTVVAAVIYVVPL